MEFQKDKQTMNRERRHLDFSNNDETWPQGRLLLCHLSISVCELTSFSFTTSAISCTLWELVPFPPLFMRSGYVSWCGSRGFRQLWDAEAFDLCVPCVITVSFVHLMCLSKPWQVTYYPNSIVLRVHGSLISYIETTSTNEQDPFSFSFWLPLFLPQEQFVENILYQSFMSLHESNYLLYQGNRESWCLAASTKARKERGRERRSTMLPTGTKTHDWQLPLTHAHSSR